MILAAVLSSNTGNNQNPIEAKLSQTAIALYLFFAAAAIVILLILFSPIALSVELGLSSVKSLGIFGIITLVLALTALISIILAFVFAWQAYLLSKNTEFENTALVVAMAISVALIFGGGNVITLGNFKL